MSDEGNTYSAQVPRLLHRCFLTGCGSCCRSRGDADRRRDQRPPRRIRMSSAPVRHEPYPVCVSANSNNRSKRLTRQICRHHDPIVASRLDGKDVFVGRSAAGMCEVDAKYQTNCYESSDRMRCKCFHCSLPFILILANRRRSRMRHYSAASHVYASFIFKPRQQNLWVVSGSGSRPSV